MGDSRQTWPDDYDGLLLEGASFVQSVDCWGDEGPHVVGTRHVADGGGCACDAQAIRLMGMSDGIWCLAGAECCTPTACCACRRGSV
jgi:disulfide bond formation protein DsbB